MEMLFVAICCDFRRAMFQNNGNGCGKTSFDFGRGGKLWGHRWAATQTDVSRTRAKREHQRDNANRSTFHWKENNKRDGTSVAFVCMCGFVCVIFTCIVATSQFVVVPANRRSHVHVALRLPTMRNLSSLCGIGLLQKRLCSHSPSLGPRCLFI